MIEGKCPKCGQTYFGWALLTPRNQMCGRCGTGLEIFEGGRKIITGYSPFSADEYRIKAPSKKPDVVLTNEPDEKNK